MNTPRAALVLTTINDPVLLDDYLANFTRFRHLDQVEIVLVPDRKTPQAAYARCGELSNRGLKCTCPTLDDQESFLSRIGVPAGFVPYDSDNRRNVGYLMAYAAGSDFLISIDDDNYCRPEEDFFAGHAAVCAGPSTQTVADSATGFLDVCDLLEMEKPRPVYARGFPYRFRHLDEHRQLQDRQAQVHINAGLWLLYPDIDAVTWLVAKPKVEAFKGASLVLGQHTWSPVNTQNTSLIRGAIPAYYFIRMGYPISGMPIDRYGDIFSGYFVQACAKQMGAAVRVGTPVAEHKRNGHNYMKDATNEWACILALEDLVPWLTQLQLTGSTYQECFRSLSFAIEDAVESFRGPVWTDVTRGYFHQMAYHMRVWLKACEQIAGC
jgi:hypothetical protein